MVKFIMTLTPCSFDAWTQSFIIKFHGKNGKKSKQNINGKNYKVMDTVFIWGLEPKLDSKIPWQKW